MKSIIPLQYYRDQIPEVQIKNMKNDGVKFQTIYNKFVELGIKGARNKNKVRDDLDYYIELGFFVKIQNENHQPLYYQTHIGGDLKTDMYLLEGVKFVKTLLDTKFKKIKENEIIIIKVICISNEFNDKFNYIIAELLKSNKKKNKTNKITKK